jgi:hypothetical protein
LTRHSGWPRAADVPLAHADAPIKFGDHESL